MFCPGCRDDCYGLLQNRAELGAEPDGFGKGGSAGRAAPARMASKKWLIVFPIGASDIWLGRIYRREIIMRRTLAGPIEPFNRLKMTYSRKT